MAEKDSKRQVNEKEKELFELILKGMYVGQIHGRIMNTLM